MRRGAAIVALLLVGGCKPAPAPTDTMSGLPSGLATSGTTSSGTTTGTAPQTDCALAGFAGPTAGLSGPELWDALTVATEAHRCSDYSATTTFMFLTLDNVDQAVECVYTGRTTPVIDTKPDPLDMNTEHTWPQSQGADTLPAKCDLHHLYPSDADTNSARAALPFGVAVGGIDFDQGGSKRGLDASGTTVFEPRDAHKGNVARSMLYFAFRYGYPLESDRIALFQDWSDADPVDAAELARSWAIAAEQEVANPLVVCPELVDRL